MFDDRKKRMDSLAEWFGLAEPHNDKVLSMLLFASEEWEEPPFKLFTDIGWLCGGDRLGVRRKKSKQHPRRTSPWQTQTIPRLDEAGEDGLCRSWRRMASPDPTNGDQLPQTLFSVPNLVNMPNCRRSSTGGIGSVDRGVMAATSRRRRSSSCLATSPCSSDTDEVSGGCK